MLQSFRLNVYPLVFCPPTQKVEQPQAQDSIARYLSFEWPHLGFHRQTQKLKPPVQHNKRHHNKVPLSSFHINGHTLGFHPRTRKLDPPVQHNKRHHRKVLLSSFHINGHTLGFHPRTRKLEPPVQHNKRHHNKVPLSSFHLNGHTLGFTKARAIISVRSTMMCMPKKKASNQNKSR